MLTGENGILTQAQNAKKINKAESDIEAIKLAMATVNINWYIDKNSAGAEDFLDELQKTDPNANISYDDSGKIIIHYNNSNYTVDEETGDIIELEQIDANIRFISLSGSYGISDEGLLYDLDKNECLNEKEGQALYGTKIKMISSEYNFTIALDEQGKVWTWGENTNGELGDITNISRDIPQNISDISGNNLNTVKIKYIDTDSKGTFAIDEDGKIWTWGSSQSLNSINNITNPLCITNEINTKFKSISTARNHGLALDEQGNVWSWGNREDGVIGDGETSGYTALECLNTISGNPLNSIQIKDIIATSNSSAVIDINGNIWTWGKYQGGYSEMIQALPENNQNSTKIDKILTCVGNDFIMMLDENNNLNSFLIYSFYSYGNFTYMGNTYNMSSERKLENHNISNVNAMSSSYIAINGKISPIRVETGI